MSLANSVLSDPAVSRALRILRKDGVAFQLAHRPLNSVSPLVREGLAYVTFRQVTQQGTEERIELTDAGRAMADSLPSPNKSVRKSL